MSKSTYATIILILSFFAFICLAFANALRGLDCSSAFGLGAVAEYLLLKAIIFYAHATKHDD